MTESIKFLVKPNSSKNSIAGVFGDMIKVKICASPEKGKANKELLEYLSTILKIPKIDIVIVFINSSRIRRSNCCYYFFGRLLLIVLIHKKTFLE